MSAPDAMVLTPSLQEKFGPALAIPDLPDWLDLYGYRFLWRKITIHQSIDPKTKSKKACSEWEVRVVLTQLSSRCIFCGQDGCLKTVRTEPQGIRDQSIRRVPCMLKVERPYYQCQKCGQRWSELLPHLDPKRDITDRLRDQVWDDSFRKTHALIETETGLDERTIRDIQKDGVRALDRSRKIELPEHIYCDEINLSPRKRYSGMDPTISIKRRMRAVFGDGGVGKPFEVFERCDETLVTQFFSQFTPAQWAGVKVITMDLSEFFDSVTRKSMPPGLPRIADHYHVKNLINRHFDADIRQRLGSEIVSESLVAAAARGITDPAELRTIGSAAKKDANKLCDHRFIMLKKPGSRMDQEKLSLEMICLAHDILKQAVAEKDALFMLWEETEDSKPKARKYKIKSADDARTAYAAWMSDLAEKTRPYWQPLINSFDRWSTEIFSFFDHPITNSPAETGNSIMRSQNQRGRDYGFPTIRGKALYRDVRGEDVPWEGEDKTDPTAASRARTFKAASQRREQVEKRRLQRAGVSHGDATPSLSPPAALVAQGSGDKSSANTSPESASNEPLAPGQIAGTTAVQNRDREQAEGQAALRPREEVTSDVSVSSTAADGRGGGQSNWTCPFDVDCMVLRSGTPCAWCHHVQCQPDAGD